MNRASCGAVHPVVEVVQRGGSIHALEGKGVISQRRYDTCVPIKTLQGPLLSFIEESKDNWTILIRVLEYLDRGTDWCVCRASSVYKQGQGALFKARSGKSKVRGLYSKQGQAKARSGGFIQVCVTVRVC